MPSLELPFADLMRGQRLPSIRVLPWARVVSLLQAGPLLGISRKLSLRMAVRQGQKPRWKPTFTQLGTLRRPFAKMVKTWDLKLRLNSAAVLLETLRWPSVKMAEPSSKFRWLVPEAAILLTKMKLHFMQAYGLSV